MNLTYIPNLKALAKIALIIGGILLFSQKTALAITSNSFQIQDEFPNYADRYAKESDNFLINEDGITWYRSPVVSNSFQLVTNYDAEEESSSSSISSESSSDEDDGGGGDDSRCLGHWCDTVRPLPEPEVPDVPPEQEPEEEPDIKPQPEPQEPYHPAAPEAEVVSQKPVTALVPEDRPPLPETVIDTKPEQKIVHVVDECEQIVEGWLFFKKPVLKEICILKQGFCSHLCEVIFVMFSAIVVVILLQIWILLDIKSLKSEMKSKNNISYKKCRKYGKK